MDTTRPYAMRARAEAVAATRERILRAALDLGEEKLTIEITLTEVAARAGTSVQTLLRHFGSRDGLIEQAVRAATAEVVEERRAPVGQPPEAVSVIVAHYERRGDFVVRLLSQETDDRVRAVVTAGRQLHRRWVEEVFQPHLDDCQAAGREALVDLLVVATDVYAWKLLRRDQGLDRATAQDRMLALVDAILRAR